MLEQTTAAIAAIEQGLVPSAPSPVIRAAAEEAARLEAAIERRLRSVTAGGGDGSSREAEALCDLREQAAALRLKAEYLLGESLAQEVLAAAVAWMAKAA